MAGSPKATHTEGTPLCIGATRQSEDEPRTHRPLIGSPHQVSSPGLFSGSPLWVSSLGLLSGSPLWVLSPGLLSGSPHWISSPVSSPGLLTGSPHWAFVATSSVQQALHWHCRNITSWKSSLVLRPGASEPLGQGSPRKCPLGASTLQPPHLHWPWSRHGSSNTQ